MAEDISQTIHVIQSQLTEGECWILHRGLTLSSMMSKLFLSNNLTFTASGNQSVLVLELICL